ncbi:MAG TPA: glycerol-3-phosphate 1-O-acyltransferase PlsY [Cytophagaceae bacterium]|jgi:glycerol-3-phosphate acyltransferase PlsY
MIYIILGAIGAYLIGSFPTAVWYGKLFFGLDVREHGSGNAGATNTFRVLGKKPGIIVMLVDVLKGWLATQSVVMLFNYGLIEHDHIIVFKLLFGILAVVGHIFPIYAQFKGGKGIATGLGMILSINIEVALICMLVFFVVFLLSKYVSLGSMIAALAFPVILLLVPKFHQDGLIEVVFGFAIFAIVVLTHQKNIKRLLNGEESKIFLKVRKKNRF